MHVIVTAGPTREPIDSVRFITNASSGRMGYAVAEAALEAGHEVTLLTGPVALQPPTGCRVVAFVTVADLKGALEEHFPNADALVMAAAVGDFCPEMQHPGKLHRSNGPADVRLVPTEDVVAALATAKRPEQVVIVFAVEDGSAQQIEAAARAKLTAKSADYVVANTPAAMACEDSDACILSPGGMMLPWGRRSKQALAREIVKLLGGRK